MSKTNRCVTVELLTDDDFMLQAEIIKKSIYDEKTMEHTRS
jgi:hypothetical protein